MASKKSFPRMTVKLPLAGLLPKFFHFNFGSFFQFTALCVLAKLPTWQSIFSIFQVFFARWCGIMASKKSFLRMTIIAPSAASAARTYTTASARGPATSGHRGRLKRPSASSGMWSSTTSILLLYLLVLEVAAFQQNFGKIGKSGPSELLLLLSRTYGSCIWPYFQ